LFANKQYAEAITEYENLKKSNFDNLYLERLAAYSYAEMGNKTDTAAYSKGLKAINTFFQKAGPSFKYLANDYKYKGLLMSRTGSDSLGTLEMEKAIAMDSSSAGDIYSAIASNAMKSKKYPVVISYLEKKLKGDYKNLNINDAFDLGKAHYFTGVARLKETNEMKDALAKKKKATNTPEIQAKEAEAMGSFAKADSAFKRMTVLNPNWPWGYTWRGRANASLDPNAQNDSTRVYYEKVLSLVKPEERTSSYKANVSEAHEYLGYYFVTKKDDAKAKEQWQQVKELDPSNKKANDYLNPKKPQAPAGANPKK
jgi:tetratricopeptide (TPR) repeat protein